MKAGRGQGRAFRLCERSWAFVLKERGAMEERIDEQRRDGP